MANQNSIGTDISINADGMQQGGGIIKRILKWLGGDVTVTGSGSNNTYTFPTSADTLVGRNSTDTLTNKVILASANTINGGIYSLTTPQTATAATTVLTGATWTMPANFATVGMVIRLKIFYQYVKTASAPNIVYTLNVGGSSVQTLTSTTLSAVATAGGWIEAMVSFASVGVSGSIVTGFVGTNDHGTIATNAAQTNFQKHGTAATTLDTTASKVISLTMNMATVVASNTLTLTQGVVEIVKI